MAIKKIHIIVPVWSGTDESRINESLAGNNHSNVGVKQGSPLSPTLYVMFIDQWKEIGRSTAGENPIYLA